VRHVTVNGDIRKYGWEAYPKSQPELRIAGGLST
jgi:hypothetical protein